MWVSNKYINSHINNNNISINLFYISRKWNIEEIPTCSVSQLISSTRFKFLFNITMCPQVKFTFAQRWVSMLGLHLFAQHRCSLLLNYLSTRLQQQLPGLWIPYGAGCCPRTALMVYPTTSLLLAAMRCSWQPLSIDDCLGSGLWWNWQNSFYFSH